MTEEQIEELADTLIKVLPEAFKATVEEWDMLRERFIMVIRDRT